LEFKTGVGGLMELEFLAQALQMRHDVWEPNTARSLVLLGERGALPADCARSLTGHYFFLRRCEAVIRRVENSSVSALPRAESDQAALAKRLGFSSLAEFLEAYSSA